MTLIYKLDRAPPVVQQVLDQLGWLEFDPATHSPYEWNLYWKTGRYFFDSNRLNHSCIFRPAMGEY